MKTTILILISCFFCAVGFSQSEGEKLANEILTEENVDHKDLNLNAKVILAMNTLDTQKDDNKVSEKEFQKKLGVLMTLKDEIQAKAIKDRRAMGKKLQAEQQTNQASSVFDLSRQRLKKKLEDGKITQVEYNARFANLAKMEKERKKKNQ